MKRILGGLALVGAIHLALGLLAAVVLAASFAMGGLVSRLGGVDRFQGVLLSMLALVASGFLLWRFVAGAVAHLASGQSQRRPRNAEQAAPGAEGAELPQTEGEESAGSRRRYDA